MSSPTVPLITSAHVSSVQLTSRTSALMVRPAAANTAVTPAPAVLWLHWLGHNRGDASQFLGEAVRLAGAGVVSLLPQGRFPWMARPTGTADDAAQVRHQLQETRAALAALRSFEGVDPAHVAVVGHDYGAMYALELRDPDLRLLVAAAPDASWSNWFLTQWPSVETPGPDYHEALRRFDLLAAAAGYGDRLALQWGQDDEYVEPGVPDSYATAAPAARRATYCYDHQLGDVAAADRETWLREALLGTTGG